MGPLHALLELFADTGQQLRRALRGTFEPSKVNCLGARSLLGSRRKNNANTVSPASEGHINNILSPCPISIDFSDVIGEGRFSPKTGMDARQKENLDFLPWHLRLGNNPFLQVMDHCLDADELVICV